MRLDAFFVSGCLRLRAVASLFGRDYKTISKHINNALREELADEVVVAKLANTTKHGAMEGKTQTHEKEYFNLEMVTSVGYRVKSKRKELFSFALCSLNRTFSLREKLLSLGNTQIYLVFHSLIRNFASGIQKDL